MNAKKYFILVAVLGLGVITFLSLSKVNPSKSQSATEKKDLVIVKIDGSSTVYPITEAIAEEYQKRESNVKVTVGIAGTGGGFTKFCNGEIHISDASRPIKTKEIDICKEKGIDFIELPIAYDGLAVVVNPKNTWAKDMTVSELKMLWEPEAQKKVTHWNQIRPSFPDKEIHLFGAGVDSGTFDYFTAAIVGTEGKSRGDYTASEDDNVLVQGVSSDEYALGYFGVAYYTQNKDKLKLVAIDDEKDENGKGAVLPDYDEVVKGTYQPLSRPIFIYVSTKALAIPEVKSFVQFYLNDQGKLAKEVGYISLPDDVNALTLERFTKQTTGSVFEGGSQAGVTIKDLMKKEQ